MPFTTCQRDDSKMQELVNDCGCNMSVLNMLVHIRLNQISQIKQKSKIKLAFLCIVEFRLGFHIRFVGFNLMKREITAIQYKIQ